MFKHYLTTALRHFRQHKLTTSINVVCLTIGLVCFLAIYTMIAFLSSGDRQYANADRVYIISQRINSSIKSPMSSWVAANYLKADFPELETVARATFNSGVGTEVPISTGEKKGFVFTAYADSAFLDVFALPFLAGDSNNALRSPRSAVITNDTALRLFGSAAIAIGRNLRLQDGTELTVRGVVGELKQPSHIRTSGDESTPYVRFDVLISMDVFEAAQRTPMTWTSFPYVFTYVVLPKSGAFTVGSLRDRLKSFAARHSNLDGNTIEFGAVSLSNFWLNGLGTMAGTDENGPIAMFYFLGVVVLLISCLNYANLATAQATTRAKEIGMRRVVGARRSQIIVQFLMEAALLSVTALLCALVFITTALAIVQVPGTSFVVGSIIATTKFWLTLVALLIAVTLAAGVYPAFVLSAVRPVQAVRAGKSRSGGRFMPRLMVGLQFAGASFLLVSMLVTTTQNRLLRHFSFADSADTLIAIANDVHAADVDFATLQAELMRQPHVKSVTASLVSPWSVITLGAPVARSPDVNAPSVRAARNSINYDFFATMGVKLLAGRVFDREHAVDAVSSTESTAAIPGLVIDQALAEQNGWLHPEEAIGQILYIVEPGKRPLPRRIVGVTENHPMSVMTPDGTKNSMYFLDPVAASHPIVRVAGTDGAAALREIESVWEKLAPSIALKMRFADEITNRNYESLKMITSVFSNVAVLALLIAVLGLIGMSFHVIGRRQHEIGVRKTLGASVRSIVRLLLTDFSKPVIVANVIAWPLAFVAMNGYLSLFTQRIALSAWPFIAGLSITIAIAWASVALQATRAARMNPAMVLRAE